jgi:hypothetical protein
MSQDRTSDDPSNFLQTMPWKILEEASSEDCFALKVIKYLRPAQLPRVDLTSSSYSNGLNCGSWINKKIRTTIIIIMKLMDEYWNDS